MNNHTKRLRIFAGPNGSGKTTLYNYLTQVNAFHTYFHINPDQITKDLAISLNLDNWPIEISYTDLENFLNNSPFQDFVDFNLSKSLIFSNNQLSLRDPTINNSYLSAAIADFLRFKMLQSNSSFSYESVFSHHSRISEVENAKKEKFRIYLYFITTSDPIINLQRVKNRVINGGHDVPNEKIHLRFFRTMNNIYSLFRLSDRAYFFDNSKENSHLNLLAEKRDDNLFISCKNKVPQWFDEFLLKNLSDQPILKPRKANDNE